MLCYHQNAVLCVHAPRGHTLSFLAKNESKFIKPCCAGNGGRRSTFAGNSVLLPSDVIDFAMLPAHSAQRFWRETVSVWDVIWRRSNQWERAMLGRNFQPFNKKISWYFPLWPCSPWCLFFSTGRFWCWAWCCHLSYVQKDSTEITVTQVGITFICFTW